MSPTGTNQRQGVSAGGRVTKFRLFSTTGELIAGAIAGGSNGGEWADDLVSVELLSDDRVKVDIFDSDNRRQTNRVLFSMILGAPTGRSFEMGGSFANARETGFGNGAAPEFQFERIGTNPAKCPESLALFEILEFTRNGDDGSLLHFAADFQFSCNITGEGPWSMGAIRYESDAEFDTETQGDPEVMPVISGRVTSPVGAALQNVLVCTGVRNQKLADARATSCVLTDEGGNYSIAVDLARTPDGQGYGEFYVHFFPFAQIQLQQQCFSGIGGCKQTDFINFSRGVYVNSHIDAQLEYGCWDKAATIVGEREGGTIVGTEGDDVIVGLDGDDLIFGLGGNDFICPGNGINTVFAGDGDDELFGGISADALSGQDGDDKIWGNIGDDKLRGGSGNDELRGDFGADDLGGGRGDDDLDGGPDGDIVRGGTGDDLVVGGAGDDPLVAGNGGTDQVYGGSGNDALVTGGPRADYVDGGDGDDRVKGLGGADVVVGQNGNDELFGGAGTDSLDGGDGVDACSGGNGFADRAFDCESHELVDILE